MDPQENAFQSIYRKIVEWSGRAGNFTEFSEPIVRFCHPRVALRVDQSRTSNISRRSHCSMRHGNNYIQVRGPYYYQCIYTDLGISDIKCERTKQNVQNIQITLDTVMHILQ